MKIKIDKTAFTMQENESGMVKTWLDENKWLTDKEISDYCIGEFLRKTFDGYPLEIISTGKPVLCKDEYKPVIGLENAVVMFDRCGIDSTISIVYISYLNMNAAYNGEIRACYQVFTGSGYWRT